jgi:hypothetical protein
MSLFRAQLATPEFHATMLALVAPAALGGLVTIWAAQSRAHWFLRALALWAAIIVLMPIRAYEPALILSVALPLVTLGVATAKRIAKRRTTTLPEQLDPRRIESSSDSRFRFTLRDVFLLVTIIGLVLAGWTHLVRKLHEFYLTYFLLTCAATSATIVLAYACVTSRRRWMALLTLVVAIGGFVPAIIANGRAGEMDVWYVIGVRYLPVTAGGDDFAMLVLALVELALLVMLGAGLIHASLRADLAPRTRRLFRLVLTASAAALLAPLGWLYWQMLWLTPLPQPFASGPNHFAKLADVADQLRLYRNRQTLSASLQSDLCDEAVILLAGPNYVPFEETIEMNPQSWTRLMDAGRSLRDLSQTLAAEAIAAEKRGDADRALALMVAGLRLGSMLARGSDHFIAVDGDIVSFFAHRRLINRRDRLSADQIRAVLGTLSQLAEEREPIADILTRDAAYQQRIWGWMGRLQFVLERLFSRHRGTELWSRVTLINDLLRTDLAIRLFRQDHGHPPPTLARLVPAYLDKLPTDPYSGQPFRYRTSDGEYTLYSVGWNQTDDDGQFANMRTYVTERGYDFDLETVVRP